jgi:hypothetical protein
MGDIHHFGVYYVNYKDAVASLEESRRRFQRSWVVDFRNFAGDSLVSCVMPKRRRQPSPLFMGLRLPKGYRQSPWSGGLPAEKIDNIGI